MVRHSLCAIVSSLIVVLLLPACGGRGSVTPSPPGASEQSRARALNSAKGHVKYRLIDMGTFGGTSSQGTNINRSGPTTVIGWSSTAFPQHKGSHPLICGGSDNTIHTVTHVFQWRPGTGVRDLGSLGGPQFCSIMSQNPPNSHGDIAGISENGLIDPQTGIDEARAVIWKNGIIHDIGSFGGYQNAALGINDRGQVIGQSNNTTPDPYSFISFVFLGSPNGTQSRAFLWEDGRMRDLGTLGTGSDSLAAFINQRGQVAGFSYINNVPNASSGIPTIDPFFWDNGRIVDLGSLGGTQGFPNAMNDRGEVVGQSNLAGDGATHPFYWNGSKMIDIGTAGGTSGAAWGITNTGEVFGETNKAGDQYEIAFIWKNGVRTDLPPLPGDCGSSAWAMDARGRIFGNSNDCAFTMPQAIGARHVVIWDHGTVTNLTDLIETGASLQVAQVGGLSQAGPGIVNDRGEIVGIGVPPGVPLWDAFEQGRAFLLVPGGK